MTPFLPSISTKNAEVATTATPLQSPLWQHRKVTFSNQAVRLHGVYDATGTTAGEIAYFLRRTFLNQHCSLCDITHSTFSRRPTWDSCVTDLGIEFHLHHRNDVPATVAAALGYKTPCVVCEYEDGSHALLVNSNELASCKNSPEQLMNLIFTKFADKTEG
jgi:hypothetical protein